MKKAPPVRLSLRKLFIAMLAVVPLAILPSPVLATLPVALTGNQSTPLGTPNNIIQVNNGVGTLTFPAANQAQITVPDKTVLVWTTGAFNIGSTETYIFSVPGGSVLNKIGYAPGGGLGGTDTATINGSLNSSGKVFVLANGSINVGSGAAFNVANGVILSTLLEANDINFIGNGNLTFSGASTGAVTLGGNATAGVNATGNLGIWSGSISVANLTVAGDLILNQAASPLGTSLAVSGAFNTSVGGNLFVSTNGGAITQPGAGVVLASSGTTTLNTNGPAAITLTNANNFGTVSVTDTGVGGIVSITDANDIVLGASTIGTDLNVLAAGNITTAGAVTVTGNASLTSNTLGNIVFGNSSSVAGANGLAASANNGFINVNTVNALTTGAISSPGSGPVTIASTGTVTINGVISDPLANVSVTAPSIASTATGVVSAANVVTFNATTGTLVLPGVTANSLVATTVNATISQQPTLGLVIGSGAVNGSFTANAGTGNITLTDVTNVMTGITNTANATSVTTTTPNGAVLSLTGNNISLVNGGNVTLAGTNAAGNVSINTSVSPVGNGVVVLGNGFGTASQGVNVGGNLTITTNGSTVRDDTSAQESIFGAVTINTSGTVAAATSAVYSLPVTLGGTGYTSAPTVTISGGGGIGATATSTINTSGVVTSITVNAHGTGYATIPTVAFSGGGGTGATSTTATTANMGLGGNVSLTASTNGTGGNAKYGQINVVADAANIQEATTLNLGNLTVNNLTANSSGGDILLNGTIITKPATSGGLGSDAQFRASSGSITEGASALLTIGGTSTFNASNSFGTNLSSTLNTFGSNVSIVNGANDFIVSNSPLILFNPSVPSGNLTATTVNATSGQITINVGNVGRTFTANSAGKIVLTSNGTNNNTTSNILNLISADLGADSISQNVTAPVSNNGTLTLTTAGGVLLNGLNNPISGTVSFNGVGGDSIVYSRANLTVNGTSFGNVTALAGTNGPNTFSTPWNLTLGNLNVSRLNAGSLNGNTTIGGLGAPTLNSGGAGYTAAPTVTFSGIAGGSGAAAVATINTSGVVTGITMTNNGVGYTSTPTLTLTAPTGVGATPASVTVGALFLTGNPAGGNATSGNSGNIVQAAGTSLHVENTADFTTFGGNIVLANNGNSLGRVQFSNGGGSGLSGTGNINYVEDATIKVGNINTTQSATLTSRFGFIIEDPLANVTISVPGVLTATANNGSILLGNVDHITGNTTGNVAGANLTAGGAAKVFSTGNIAIGTGAANSLTVTGNTITETGPLNVFGLSSFTSTGSGGILLTNSGNNFGPISITTTNSTAPVAITEAGTLNLRSVTMPAGGNGTFSVTSLNGDIIDTGLAGVKPGGTNASMGTGLISLSAANGNITIDDPTSDFQSISGVVFNAKNVTLQVLGGNTTNPVPLILGNSTTSSVAGNLTASSALSDILSAGNLTVSGNASFQAPTKNITLLSTANQFGTLKFVGNQVTIQQVGDMKIATGSQAVGISSLTASGNISVFNPNNSGVISFGNVAALNSAGTITLSKVQAVGTLTVNAPGLKDLTALSLSLDLNNKTPNNQGSGVLTGPSP